MLIAKTNDGFHVQTPKGWMKPDGTIGEVRASQKRTRFFSVLADAVAIGFKPTMAQDIALKAAPVVVTK